MSKQDEYYRQQDYELEQGAYEAGQGSAQDQYLAGYVDLGHQAGFADYRIKRRSSPVGEESPGHNAHQQVYGKVLFRAEEVSEEKVQDTGQQKRAEQRP